MALQPSASAVAPRYDLLGAYHQHNRGGFVAPQVLPELIAPGLNGYYGVVPKQVALAYISTKRAAKGVVSRSEWTPSSGNYAIDEFTHEMMVDFQEAERYGGWFDLYDMNTMLCAGVVEMDIEVDCAAAVFNDTTFAADGVTGATVSTAWSTWASATPLQDMIAGFNALRDNFGIEANAFICTKKKYDDVCNTAEFRDRAQYVGVTPANASKADFMKVIGNAMTDAGLTTENFKLILPWARRNTANPSVTPTLSSIWATNRAMLTRIVDGPDWMSPQLGRQFKRAVVPEIVTYPEKAKGEVVCCTQYVQNLIFGSAPGYMFRGI